MKKAMKIKPVKRVLDIGCGCGAYYQLCQKEFPDLKYIGIDYSEHAVTLARKSWDCYFNFHVLDLWKIIPEDLMGFDIVISDALFNVLPNADEALEHFLQVLSPEMTILNRMDNGPAESSYKTYNAYNLIPTYGYYHNRDKLLSALKGYQFKESGNAFLAWR